MPKQAEANMSCEEQPCLDCSLLTLLIQVPQLLMEISRQSAVKELRSVCRHACVLATAEITRITVKLEDPTLSMALLQLPHLLEGCSVRCLGVELKSCCYDQLEQDLKQLASTLAPYLTKVSHIDISLTFVSFPCFKKTLRGYAGFSGYGSDDSLDVVKPEGTCLAGDMSAAAVRVLAPLCGPLTSLTVTGLIQPEEVTNAVNEFNIYPLLKALHDVDAAATIQKLSISVSGTHTPPYSSFRHKLWVHLGELPGNVQLYNKNKKSQALLLPLLHGFVNLTELVLSGGSVMSEDGWLALPPNLKTLELQLVFCSPKDSSCLSSLKELRIAEGGLTTMAEILATASALTSFSIDLVDINPCCEWYLSPLKAILQHPYQTAITHGIAGIDANFHQPQLLYVDGSKPIKPHGCSIHRLKLSGSNPTERNHLGLMGFLAELPVMNSVCECDITFNKTTGHDLLNPEVVLAFVIQLVRVLPCVRKLSIFKMQLSDEAVSMLSSLASLRNLYVCSQGLYESVSPERISSGKEHE